MAANGQLVFTDVDKVTFKGVGNTSNAVIDTTTGKIGVGVDSPDANLHVLGNCFVSTNFELGGTMSMGTVTVRAQHELSAITATGNTTPHTVEFQNAETGFVTTSNVGIGTSTPLETLDVYGGFLVRPERTTTTYSNTWNRSDGDFYYNTTPQFGSVLDVIYSKNAIYTTTGGLKVSPPSNDSEFYYIMQHDAFNPGLYYPLPVSITSPYLSGDVFSSTRFKADNTEDFTGFAIGQDYQGGNQLNDFSQDLDIAKAHSAHMYFKTASLDGSLTEKMRITNTGNVGIGTTTPLEKLDVRGAIITPVVSYTGNQDAAYLIAGTSGYTGAATNWNTHGFQHRIKSNSGGVPRITVDAPTGGEVFSIVNGGNVGIGTTNPQYRLDVGNGGGDVMLRVMNQTASSGKLIFGRSGDTEIRSHAIESYNSSGSQNNYMKFLVHDGTGTSPYETRTEVMTLLGNGNVGIGITSPSAPLDVRGVENPDMMAMFKTVSAAMRFHTGQGGTSNNWKNTEISLSGGSGGGAILFCFTMNNSSGDRSGAILYFIRKSHTADGTTNGDWNNDSSSVFKISGLSGGGSATSLDFQRNGNKLEYRTSSVGNGYFYAIEFD